MSITDLKPSELGRKEHNDDANAKRVVIRYQDPATGTWYNTVPTESQWDYIAWSNADGGGNYQTITYKTGGSGGTTTKTLALTFDGSNNVTSITRT